MDRQRRRTLALALLFAGFGSVGATAVSVAPPLRALAWLPAGADPVAALDAPPAECLQTPADAEAAYRVEVGRAAFRTPMLLGGQAARSGVSCESCHQAGRTNPFFAFPGVSGPPGTADVTSSTFSSHRGDGVDNPRPIPDLGGPKSALKVSQAGDGKALSDFVRGLIVEEFDGHEPQPAVLAGVVAYVRALSPAACPASPAPVSLHSLMEDARRAARAASGALDRKDAPTALLLIDAVRSTLGAVDERYLAAGLTDADKQLRAADVRLRSVADRVRAGGPAAEDLQTWIGESQRLERALAPLEARSLFDPERLRAIARRKS